MNDYGIGFADEFKIFCMRFLKSVTAGDTFILNHSSKSGTLPSAALICR